jgi:type 1 glutamine amidotransferase
MTWKEQWSRRDLLSRIPYNTQLYKFDQVVSDKNRFMFRANLNYHESNDTDYFGFDNPALGAFFWTEAAGVFYSSLGHTNEAWENPDVQRMYLDGVKWTMKRTEGGTASHPKVK